MKVQATFNARHWSDGSVTLICRETGERYSFCERSFEAFPVFREGQVMAYRRGRAPALALIESDAKWRIRDDIRQQEAEKKGRKVLFVL